MSFKRKYWYPISVSIELSLRRVRKTVDRFYRKTWLYFFLPWVIIIVSVPFVGHYYEQRNQIDRILNEPFSEKFQHWDTSGSPGKEPVTGPTAEEIREDILNQNIK